MSIVSQVLPCFFGGLAGGVFNTIGGVAKHVSAVAVPTFKQGFIFGALGGMATKIIYSRTEQIKHHYKETFENDTFATGAVNATAYALMLLSWHGARYVANNYLGFEIAKRTIVMMSVVGVFMAIPFVSLWTFTSDPNFINDWEENF